MLWDPAWDMSAMDSLITISIPTYRRPTLLVHCLWSCFAQDYRPLEIDVGDNSLADDTRNLVASMVPPPGVTMRYWKNDPPIGSVGNVRKLFDAARGQRLVLMNDDDTLLSGAVSALDRAFRMAPDVVAAYGALEVINEAGEYLAAETESENLQAKRTPDHAGLRRDLLTLALWRQFPPIGYLIGVETARKIGYRDRSEVGLAADTDFGIRLAQTYTGSAFAILDHPICQFRLSADSQRWTQRDTCWLFYNDVARLGGLTAEEESARDWMMKRIARAAVLENALGRRRKAALKIFFSSNYPRSEDPLRTLYALGMIAMPTLTYTARKLIRVT